MVWQINQKHHPHDSIDEFIGDLLYERPGGAGPSWHPDSSKIAYVVTVHPEQDPQDASDFAGSHAAIWDLDFGYDCGAARCVHSPSLQYLGRHRMESRRQVSLASISSDGRIVIWDTSSYEIVAEYAGYQSILDRYKENP